ncbi:MAG: D-alanyl-D-alanine carboxypeptidase [Pseudobdellovibrio sp.]
MQKINFLKKIKCVATFSIITLVAALKVQASPITFCYAEGQKGSIKGSGLDTLHPIASVSKVYTSLWALDRLGANYRFKTQVYITKVDANSYDVHLRGSVFPYFDQSMLYYLIVQLNQKGVKNINNLTYDQNFEYGTIIRARKELRSQNADMSETEIMRELRSSITNLSKNYPSFRSQALRLAKVSLPEKVSLSVKDIHHVSIEEFKSVRTDSSFTINSVPLHRILKEMNRNSHNFAANKIFERLSRTESFSSYMMKSVSATNNEIRFVNGSGYPEYINGKKIYNSASCRTSILVIQRLYKIANSQNIGLRAILPVAGVDAKSDPNSTVTNIYLTNGTDGALVAKTGTISGLVSLSGVTLTKENIVFFYTAGTSYGDNRAFLQRIIKDGNGKDPIEGYNPKAFLPFDENSVSFK